MTNDNKAAIDETRERRVRARQFMRQKVNSTNPPDDDLARFAAVEVAKREGEIADELMALFGTMSVFDDTKQFAFEQNFRECIQRLRKPEAEG